jgi:type IV pilus assembly protein PilQ
MLDLQLSAMEDSGNGKILSNPKILTLNNKEASISSGTQVLIPTVLTTGASTTSGTDGGTTGVTEKEATLKLTVTPHITFDNKILLKIQTKREEFDFTRQVLGIPPKNIKEAETDLMVRDGETIAIGGIYTENNFEGDAGVPFLSKIPVLGWLFKKEGRRENKNELMIFITPTIYRGGEPGTGG